MGLLAVLSAKSSVHYLRLASEEKEKTEQELPFAVMIFTLMAASGISPYDSWKRMRKLTFLPAFKKEADEVVRQVEVLGKDPLTVMQHARRNNRLQAIQKFSGRLCFFN